MLCDSNEIHISTSTSKRKTLAPLIECDGKKSHTKFTPKKEKEK